VHCILFFNIHLFLFKCSIEAIKDVTLFPNYIYKKKQSNFNSLQKLNGPIISHEFKFKIILTQLYSLNVQSYIIVLWS